MPRSMIVGLFTGFFLVATPLPASAGLVDFEFTATPTEGAVFSIPDDGYALFFLTMEPSAELTGNSLDYPLNIVTLELEIEQLSHDVPEDLIIYLYDPRGGSVNIMSELGGMTPVQDITLTFNDNGGPLPPPPDPLVEGTFVPQGGRFSDVPFDDGMVDSWMLFVIDDSPGNAGTFASWTLRGTVPEPMTLPLLGLGALALLRQRRR